MPKDYAWKRFWYQPDTTVNRDAGGYLIDPESTQYPGNPDILPFEDISSNQCLILLGEPGAGKSHSLYSEYKSIQKDAAENVKAYWLDLRTRGEGALVQELREGHEIAGWVENKHDLHLFLDSFDECQSRIPYLIDLLTSEINRFIAKRDGLIKSKEKLKGSKKIQKKKALSPHYLSNS
jgi:hypothetical protein